MLRRNLIILGCILALLGAYSLVQPSAYALDQDATQFQKLHMNPFMEVTADFTEPLKSGVNNTFQSTFRIEFAPLELKSTETENPNHHVETYIDNSPANILDYEYEYGEWSEIEHWYDGTITREPMDKTGLQERQTGKFYEGWFPSPNQIMDYIAYQNGWILNYVVAAERGYECIEGGQIVDLITEARHENFLVNSDYTADTLVIEQAPMAKAIGFPTSEKAITDESNLNMAITQLNSTIKGDATVLATLGIVIVICITIWIICDAWVQTDSTPYGVKHLADAYADGFADGVNETIDEYERRLAERLASGDLSNETYALLLNELRGTYDTVMANFVNPYEGLEVNGGNDWWHTILWIIETAIIIVVIIVFVMIIAFIYKRFPRSKSKRGE